MSDCPDYSDCRWCLARPAEAGLAVVTAETGFGVLELGLRPGDDGHGTLSRLAGVLVDAHNATLPERDRPVPVHYKDSPGLPGEVWHLASTDRTEPATEPGGPAEQVITSYIFAGARVEHRACCLGDNLMVNERDRAVLSAARAVVEFHNALLAAGAYEKGVSR